MTNIPRRRLIGVLGGMGPAATVDFLSKIVTATPAATDQEHVPVIVHGVPQIPDRSTAIESGTDAPYLPMLAGLRMLERSGAEVVAIPCNTAHHWYDRLARTTPLEIIHIVDAVRDELHTRNLTGPIAILATRGTIASGLYQQRLASIVRTITPDEGAQSLIDQAIAAVKGSDTARGRRTAEAAVQAMIAQGAQAVLMACTEVPVALHQSHLPVAVIDATAALAQACVAASMGHGRRPLPRTG